MIDIHEIAQKIDRFVDEQPELFSVILIGLLAAVAGIAATS
jgi:hypothetical protein